eukprot:gene10117-8018_t
MPSEERALEDDDDRSAYAMKKQSQLAELIMGAGLVGGTAVKKAQPKEESSEESSVNDGRPVLYGYGPGGPRDDSNRDRSHSRPTSGPSGRTLSQRTVSLPDILPGTGTEDHQADTHYGPAPVSLLPSTSGGRRGGGECGHRPPSVPTGPSYSPGESQAQMFGVQHGALSSGDRGYNRHSDSGQLGSKSTSHKRDAHSSDGTHSYAQRGGGGAPQVAWEEPGQRAEGQEPSGSEREGDYSPSHTSQPAREGSEGRQNSQSQSKSGAGPGAASSFQNGPRRGSGAARGVGDGGTWGGGRGGEASIDEPLASVSDDGFEEHDQSEQRPLSSPQPEHQGLSRAEEREYQDQIALLRTKVETLQKQVSVAEEATCKINAQGAASLAAKDAGMGVQARGAASLAAKDTDTGSSPRSSIVQAQGAASLAAEDVQAQGAASLAAKDTDTGVQAQGAASLAAKDTEMMDKMTRNLKASKAAEEKSDKLELSRRQAEARVQAADAEFTALRTRLEAKSRECDALASSVAATQLASEQLRRGGDDAVKQLPGEHKAALKKDLDECDALASSVAATQLASEQLRRGGDEAVKQLREEHKAALKKAAADFDVERKELKETLEKIKMDMAKRTQTILATQADMEAAMQRAEAAEAQLADMDAAMQRAEAAEAQLVTVKEELELSRQPPAADPAAPAPDTRPASEPPSPAPPTSTRSAPAPSPNPTSKPPPSGSSQQPAATAQLVHRRSSLRSSHTAEGLRDDEMDLSGGDDDDDGRMSVVSRSSKGSMSSKQRGGQARSSSSGAAGASAAVEMSKMMRRYQTEVAEIREDYARRLIPLEASLSKSEERAKEAIVACERLFDALVRRTAGVLAGRLVDPSGVLPSPAVASTSSQRPPRPSVSSHGRPPTQSRGNAVNAEIARWQSGKHPMLRKLGMGVLGADAPAGTSVGTPPTPTASNSSSGGGVSIVPHGAQVGGQPTAFSATRDALSVAVKEQPAAAALAAACRPCCMGPRLEASPPLSQKHGMLSRWLQRYQHWRRRVDRAAWVARWRPVHSFLCNTGCSLGSCEAGGNLGSEFNFRAALIVLLASKKEMLPAVMTAEGWALANGGRSSNSGSASGGYAGSLASGASRSNEAVNTAEANLSLRASVMTLQAEVLTLQAELSSAQSGVVESAQVMESHENAMKDLKRELAAANRQVHDFQDKARCSWAPSLSSYAGSDDGSLSSDQLESKVRAAKEDATRQRNNAAAAKRDKEQVENDLEDLQAQYSRLQSTTRDLRAESSKQDDSIKRLRQLLGQAKGMLKTAGVPFLEEDFTIEPKAKSNKAARTSEGGALVKALEAREKEKLAMGFKFNSLQLFVFPMDVQLQPCVRVCDIPVIAEDGVLFKALEAREKEKEMQRIQRELAEAQHDHGMAQKELKRLRKQVEQLKEGSVKASEAAAKQLDTTTELLRNDLTMFRDKSKKFEAQLRAADNELSDVRRTRDDLKSQLDRVKADAEYLRNRASKPRPKPRLFYVEALNLHVSSTSMAGED